MHQVDFIGQLMRLLTSADGGRPRFRKRGYQLSPFLLRRAAQSIIHQLPGSVDAVCALGTSGLALGVFLAHELFLPLYFYKTDGWPKLRNGRVPRVLPEPNMPLKVLMVDSHYRSSYSWAKAESYLRESTPLEPVAIGLILHPDTNSTLRECTVPVLSVIKATENVELLSDVLACRSESELAQILRPESEFWGARRRPTDVGAAGRYLRHAGALLLPGEELDPSFEIVRIAPELRARVGDISVSDPGIWRYYLCPELVQEMAAEIGRVLVLEQYSRVVGVSVLGTALALSLIYHNMAALGHVSVFSSYFEKRLVPPPDEGELVGTKILLTQMRLTTGLLTNDALRLIEKEKGVCQTLLAIRTDLSLEPRRRQRPLHKAAGRGLERIYTLVRRP
jgi:hypothetical protein